MCTLRATLSPIFLTLTIAGACVEHQKPSDDGESTDDTSTEISDLPDETETGVDTVTDTIGDGDPTGDGDGDGDGDCDEWPVDLPPGLPCVLSTCAIMFEVTECTPPYILLEYDDQLCVNFITGECSTAEPCPEGWSDVCLPLPTPLPLAAPEPELVDDCAIPCCDYCREGLCYGCHALNGACAGSLLACVGGCWSGETDCSHGGSGISCCT